MIPSLSRDSSCSALGELLDGQQLKKKQTSPVIFFLCFISSNQLNPSRCPLSTRANQGSCSNDNRQHLMGVFPGNQSSGLYGIDRTTDGIDREGQSNVAMFLGQHFPDLNLWVALSKKSQQPSKRLESPCGRLEINSRDPWDTISNK